MQCVHTTFKKPVTTYEEIEQFDLTLTREEAEFLMDLSGRIGGNSTTSRRRHACSLSGALSIAGIRGTAQKDLPKGQALYFDDIK